METLNKTTADGSPYTLVVNEGKPFEVKLGSKVELFDELKKYKGCENVEISLYDKDGRDITEFQWVEEIVYEIIEGADNGY